MKKRILGRTGWELSVIGFGGIKLPRISQKECDILLNLAIDKGINFVDTADCYGDSEEKIGKALGHRRREFYLATKVDERDGSGVRNKLERCFKRLGTDYIDLVLFHDVRGSEYEWIFHRGGFEAIEEARRQGMVREIGISIHNSISMMKRAIESGAFSALMVAFSVLDEDRLAADLLPMAHDRGVGLIAMKPLAGGKLAESKGSSKGGGILPTESLAQLSLRYVLSNPYITCAIPGMTKTQELEENLYVGHHIRELGPEEIKKLMEFAGDAGKGFCRNCGYCLPCPEGVPIPDIFRLEGYHERYGLSEWAKEQYKSLEVDATGCLDCGQCLEQCPYAVPVPERLREAHRILN
jgi:uncharacterized protein